ncbi:MAG: hypothetical protein ACKOZU_11435 [Planctomycetaceae bacterium]
MHLRFAVAVVAIVLSAAGLRAFAADVVAVVACDPYADLKKQIRWVGTLIGQPQLDALAESPLMFATQFKGLAGLDVSRPIGLVVTAAGDAAAVHAYVPVKDIDRLLDSLSGMLGPVEQADGVRRVSPPGAMPLDIVEKDGWAIVGPPGAAAPVADPTESFAGIVKQFALGVQAFPSRMPEGMREQLQAQIDQAAAAQGATGMAAAVESLNEVEGITLGLAIDTERDQVSIETRSSMTAASPAGRALAEMAKGATTVATPATSDGKPAALALHLAAAVPEARRREVIDGLAAVRAEDGADAASTTAMSILREALTAMIEAGGYDASLAIDTSVVTDEMAVPAVTAGMKVKDGRGLEAAIKKLFAGAGEVPGLATKFDAGEAAGAKLHRLTLKDTGLPGVDAIDVTLAVAPTYAWLLTGPDVPKRLAAVAGASGKPDAKVKPMADATVALGPVLRYMAAVARAQGDVAADPAGLEAAAEVADAQKSALVQLLVRPIERGMTLRLAADAGAIRTVAASVNRRPAAARPGVPATGGPDPIPFAVPVQ